jgi:hypothetical protein
LLVGHFVRKHVVFSSVVFAKDQKPTVGNGKTRSIIIVSQFLVLQLVSVTIPIGTMCVSLTRYFEL